MVGSVSIDRIAHDSLFSKAERFIYVAGAIIVHENIQKETVRSALTKCPISNRGQKPFARALIGEADDKPLELYGPMFGKQAAQDGEGSDVPLLIFCHEIACIRIGQVFQVLIRRPATNERAELRQCLQPANLRNIANCRASELHGKRLTGLLF